MAKHRGSVFTVVRERFDGITPNEEKIYTFSAIVGTYLSLQRAEEVVGLSQQAFRDAGIGDDDYRFSVKVNTYYDE